MIPGYFSQEQWRQMSAKASQILLTRLYVQQPIQASQKQPQMFEQIQWEVGLIWLKHRHPTCLISLQMLTIVFRKNSWRQSMMTSSNGNVFRVTGPLCGEFIGPGEFSTQRPVTRSFDVFFDLRLNKRLSKQPWGWWFVTPSCPLWRQCNVCLLAAFWTLSNCFIMLFTSYPSCIHDYIITWSTCRFLCVVCAFVWCLYVGGWGWFPA